MYIYINIHAYFRNRNYYASICAYIYIYIYVLCLLKAVTLRRYNTRLPEDPEGVFVHELGPSQLCGDIELACFVVAVVATLPKTCSNMLKSKSSTTTEQI